MCTGHQGEKFGDKTKTIYLLKEEKLLKWEGGIIEH